MAQVNYLSNGLVFIKKESGTSVASISIDNCFSADYSQYKIICDLTDSSGASSSSMRMRSGGSDNASGNYNRQYINYFSTSVDGGRDTSQTSWNGIGSIKQNPEVSILEILNPFQSTYTSINSYIGYEGDNLVSGFLLSGGMTVTTSYDGFSIIGAGNLTGTIYVYGYKES